jgi:hypothetical protein
MNDNNNDLNLLIGLLGLGTNLLGILVTILIVAFGALAGLIVAAFIAGSVTTAAVMWHFLRRAPP